jgi:putative transposase
MIDREHGLSLVRQAEVLDLSRSSLYYAAKQPSEPALELMREIDRLHLEDPFAGARMLRDMLRANGYKVGRRHVATVMRLMGIAALYRKRSTSKRNPQHRVFRYLLRNLTIERPNHVWAADITYIPMRHGFLYLFAVLDWATRRVLAWRLSNSLTSDFCIDAVQEAVENFGVPQIFNTDQGSQFTDESFVKLIRDEHHIALSMDGKGCWRDNVFVERFWKSLKYEEVYLRAYERVSEAKTSLARYITFYNERRPRSALDARTRTRYTSTQLPLRRRNPQSYHLSAAFRCSKKRGHL